MRNTCMLKGCGKPTFNGKPNEYCSKTCQVMDQGGGYQNICMLKGCGKPTFNGKPNEYCSKTCHDMDQGGDYQPGSSGPRCDPQLDAIEMDDPRGKDRPKCPVIAFYFPGNEEPCDLVCGAGFLGNFYEPPKGIFVDNNHYTNSEAAFQATKFIKSGHAKQFQNLSGYDAFSKKNQLKQFSDMSYGPHGNNWTAMWDVLQAKFKNPICAQLLKKTGDAFLLEHNSTPGRDSVWSDNHDGTGTNWLGLQLMCIRDELNQCSESPNSWTQQLGQLIDFETGSPKGPPQFWQSLVQEANRQTMKRLQPVLDAIFMNDPRVPGDIQQVGVIAFYFPGVEQPWDKICHGGFMGNFYELQNGIMINGLRFTNAESAFQATKFVSSGHAKHFQTLSGNDAFSTKNQLKQFSDKNYGPHGNNWTAMWDVLQVKFQDPECKKLLLQTGDCFLIEHNAVAGRDLMWSDNYDGTGTNWLGLQLMLLRDQIRGEKNWAVLMEFFDMNTGMPKNPTARDVWQDVIKSANKAIMKRFPEK